MEIGITIASDKYPNTIDSFWFAIRPEAVVNPFDFVTVEHVHDTNCIGMVQYSQTLRDENPKDDSFTEVTVVKVAFRIHSHCVNLLSRTFLTRDSGLKIKSTRSKK